MGDAKGRPTNGHNVPMMKMKELCDATGVPKSTILLYVSKGLLPVPVKTSPNMAYYDPDCIPRIQFIKNIQASHRLPLAAIKGLLKEMDKGRDIAPLLELQSSIFGEADDKMTPKSFARATGLTRHQLDTLCRLELIVPLEDNCFDSQDLDLACQLKTCMDLGFQPEEFCFYPKFAKQIVDAEIALRDAHTQELTFQENAAFTLDITRVARALRAYVTDRILQKRLIAFKGLKNPDIYTPDI